MAGITDQAQCWSEVADSYETEFVDPYREDVKNPLVSVLQSLATQNVRTIADLGCGTGPLLPFLTKHFQQVWAVDFAEGMLERARQRCCPDCQNLHFLRKPLTELNTWDKKLDAAVAINSLVMPDIKDLQIALQGIHHCLRPGGHFLAIFPAIDAVHYYTMLLVDRALALGKSNNTAQTQAARFAEHQYYDFAFGQFSFKGIRQHFWQPFEIRHRLKQAGFRKIRISKVWLSWEQFACGVDFQKQHRPPWDWFARAEVKG